MPYTKDTAPSWVKILPAEAKDAWIKAFNAALKEYDDEGRAMATASSTIKKMGYGKNEKGKWVKMMEANIAGSFEDTRDKVQAGLDASGLFPRGDIGGKYISGPWIKAMFSDKVIIDYNGFLYQVSYSIVDDVITIGKVKEVEETYIVKESIESELKEAKIQKISEAKDEDIVVSDYLSLKEAKWNDETSEVEVTLIEAGTNLQKKRHYPVKTIQEAAGGFAGLKMYINHPTPSEEKERPERNLKDWASTIVESRYDNGKAIGRVAIHDAWLRERLKDPVAREHIGLSINTGGKVSVGKVNGTDMQIVEKIVFARKSGPVSVDWVTEPGARGRVNRLLESRTGGHKMELENATLKDLKESRTDLIEAIGKETSVGHTDKVSKLEKDLKESNDKIAALEKKEKISGQANLVETALKEAKIPDAAKDKVREHFKTNLVEGSEADLKEAVAKSIKTELEYVNKISTKGTIKTGEGASADLKESLGAELDKRAGIKTEEKK